jgi:hypothetical protein
MGSLPDEDTWHSRSAMTLRVTRPEVEFKRLQLNLVLLPPVLLKDFHLWDKLANGSAEVITDKMDSAQRWCWEPMTFRRFHPIAHSRSHWRK